MAKRLSYKSRIEQFRKIYAGNNLLSQPKRNKISNFFLPTKRNEDTEEYQLPTSDSFMKLYGDGAKRGNDSYSKTLERLNAVEKLLDLIEKLGTTVESEEDEMQLSNQSEHSRHTLISTECPTLVNGGDTTCRSLKLDKSEIYHGLGSSADIEESSNENSRGTLMSIPESLTQEASDEYIEHIDTEPFCHLQSSICLPASDAVVDQQKVGILRSQISLKQTNNNDTSNSFMQEQRILKSVDERNLENESDNAISLQDVTKFGQRSNSFHKRVSISTLNPINLCAVEQFAETGIFRTSTTTAKSVPSSGTQTNNLTHSGNNNPCLNEGQVGSNSYRQDPNECGLQVYSSSAVRQSVRPRKGRPIEKRSLNKKHSQRQTKEKTLRDDPSTEYEMSRNEHINQLLQCIRQDLCKANVVSHPQGMLKEEALELRCRSQQLQKAIESIQRKLQNTAPFKVIRDPDAQNRPKRRKKSLPCNNTTQMLVNSDDEEEPFDRNAVLEEIRQSCLDPKGKKCSTGNIENDYPKYLEADCSKIKRRAKNVLGGCHKPYPWGTLELPLIYGPEKLKPRGELLGIKNLRKHRKQALAKSQLKELEKCTEELLGMWETFVDNSYRAQARCVTQEFNRLKLKQRMHVRTQGL